MLADPLSRKRRHFPKMEGRRFVCLRYHFLKTINPGKKNAQPEGARFFEIRQAK
ncbi:hypothetical protein [Rhizobium laguerreae]|jgi:hypothetical protein|uniref:Uncharacterized protein n=1 Tax=Rhizobium laguerreae TaxID=1076926 RepID=A0A6N9ZF88_9HYPH|nr:hypothetical protein [Rhizobium laguerreae]NEH92103.1 hypothetical protein [Rhizobium laguerreae]